jgi:hypothetical protein
LLSLGADVAAKDKAGNTSVWLAIENGRHTDTYQCFYVGGHPALQQKHEAAIEVLLQAMMAAGMDIDAPYEGICEYSIGTGTLRKQGQTLLMHASQTGLTSLVVKLLALGADLSAKDANQKDPIDYADNIVLDFFQVLINNNNIGINAYQVLINNKNDDDKNNHPPAPGPSQYACSIQVGVSVSRVLARVCEHGRAVPWRRVTVDEHQAACMLTTTWRASVCSTR